MLVADVEVDALFCQDLCVRFLVPKSSRDSDTNQYWAWPRTGLGYTAQKGSKAEFLI